MTASCRSSIALATHCATGDRRDHFNNFQYTEERSRFFPQSHRITGYCRRKCLEHQSHSVRSMNSPVVIYRSLSVKIVPSTKSTDRSLHNRATAWKYCSQSEWRWCVSLTNGLMGTSFTFSFSTYPSVP